MATRQIQADRQCEHCGYNLRGLDGRRCPECGTMLALLPARLDFKIRLACAALIGFTAFRSMAGNPGEWWSPNPLASFLALIPFGFAGVPLIFVGVSLITTWHVTTRVSRIPLLSRVAMNVLVITNVVWLAAFFRSGLHWHGTAFTWWIVGVNVVMMAAMPLLRTSNRRDPRMETDLLFHVLLVLWLGWCAFPWMGEMI